MRKSVIALAVTGGLLASAVTYADTTFYGSFRTSLFMQNPDAPGYGWEVQDEGSRWGVRGSEDLGAGLSATYQLEARVNSGAFNQGFGGDAFGGRLLWMGLEGGFGAVRIGTQWSPYYIDVIARMDQFNAVGDVLYNNSVTPFRLNNSLLYQTPASLDMFKFAAAVVLDGRDDVDEADSKAEIDRYNLAVTTNFGPAGLGIAYDRQEFRISDSVYSWTIAGDVNLGPATIAASYEDGDGDVDFFNLYGDYSFGNNIVRAHWGHTNPDGGSTTNDFALGFQHNMSARTRVWAEYAYLDEDRADRGDDRARQGESLDLFSVGMRHDF